MQIFTYKSWMVQMVKWDGHTHSVFCRHGQGDETARMVERAIELGFERYSIVEHAPLPEGVLKDDTMLPEFGLRPDEVGAYLNHIRDLKKTYGRKIEILAGLEIDFFETEVEYTQDLLNSLEHQLEDTILSVHFLPAGEHYMAVDYTPEELTEDLVGYYGTISEVFDAYWRTIKTMATAVSIQSPLKRIGHIGLIYKFFDAIDDQGSIDQHKGLDKELWRSIKLNGWALDFNMAGYVKKYWRQPYVTRPMVELCRDFDIPLVYGSDAHSVEAIGQYHDRFIELTR